MIRGLYTAVSGMVATARRMEVATNNLSNAETVGYKQERTAGAAFDEQLVARLTAQSGRDLGRLTLANVPQVPLLDLGQGALQATDRPLDVALEGPGFLAVDTAQGTRYTRDGSLTRDADGYLTTQAGARVLGEYGPIQVGGGAVTIDADGTVRAGDAAIDRLQVVEFGPDDVLERVGRNELVPQQRDLQPQPAVATTVRQGYVEASNVDVTGVLTTTLGLQRAYEANQRMIRAQDDLLSRAVTEIARPGN
ncbi:MAG TPA: flagellar hook-basal body protein [Chloroflexota bacterium]|nr:flagellar hook-basal body protein [Chloroflexota bacterium]